MTRFRHCAVRLLQCIQNSKILALTSRITDMAVTLTEKGQITIPLAIRKRLGLKAGMRFSSLNPMAMLG